MSFFRNYLSQYEEEYQKAEVQATGELPDGKYIVRIDRVELTTSKTSNRPQMVWDMIITEGTYQGWHVWKYNGLDSAEKIHYLKNDLHRADLPLERISDLESALPQLLDRKLEVRVKTKLGEHGESQNVYINKCFSNKTALPTVASKSSLRVLPSFEFRKEVIC
jgi:hypothetical protein